MAMAWAWSLDVCCKNNKRTLSPPVVTLPNKRETAIYTYAYIGTFTSDMSMLTTMVRSTVLLEMGAESGDPGIVRCGP